MLKPSLLALMLVLSLFVTQVQGGYERNQAVPVEKVVYGQLESVRHITEKELIEDRSSGWKTFGGAVLGGVIGHQFGGGSGQDVATVLGAIIGAGVANQASSQNHYQEYRLIEMMIKQEDGTQVMVIQDKDAKMHFSPGDEVRVVYLVGSVRVDKAM